MSGLTDAGFTRKTLLEILDSLKQEAKNVFGTEFNTNDDTPATQLLGVFAIELDEIWQGLEGAYSAYTYTGAEGIYLDDLFSRHNIIRLPATAGSGSAYIESDNTTVLPQSIATTISIENSNGITYAPQVTSTIDTEFTSAYKILSGDISTSTSYTVYIKDANGALQSTVLSTTDEASKGTFVDNLKTFVDTHQPSIAGSVKAFNGDKEFYIGFDDNKSLSPLATEIDFYIDTVIGNRYTKVSIEANETGYNPAKSNSITGMTPDFTGFVSISNPSALTSGTEVESDAAFRARFNRLIDASPIGSDRQSIESALINLNGVVDARIYENPTPSATPEAAAFSYNSVVVGGSPDDIAQVLFDQGPINVSTDGTVIKQFITSSGSPITIKFTPALTKSLLVDVAYTTADLTNLNTFEQQEIREAIADLSLNFGIGSTVYNIQLTSAVISSLPYGRLTSLTVTMDSGGGFNSGDYTTLFNEFPVIDPTDISFTPL